MHPASTLLDSSLKIIFFLHLVFTSWGLQSDWAPTSYFFYNLIFLLVLLSGLNHQQTDNAVILAIWLNIICLFLDIVNVGVFFPSRSSSTSRRFSAGMAIVNMLLRPITTFFLYKFLSERPRALTGISVAELENTSCFGDILGTGNNRRGQYQDIVDPLPPAPIPKLISQTKLSPQKSSDSVNLETV